MSDGEDYAQTDQVDESVVSSGLGEGNSSISLNRTDDDFLSDIGVPGFARNSASATRRGKSAGRVRTKSQDNEAAKENKTRARPRKPHEPGPFLSVDNLPVSKPTGGKLDNNANNLNSFVSGPAEMSYVEESMKVPYNTPHASRGHMIGSAGSVVSSEWNNAVPRQHKYGTPHVGQVSRNTQVQSPFKHNVKKNNHLARRPVSPGAELREKTMMATQYVARNLAKQKPPTEKVISGKLLKAKLKPLYPVKTQGPTMEHCRGVVAETRPHYPSSSRTLQRRREILSSMGKDYMPERPQTGESIHRTSIASDLSENRMREIQPDLDIFHKQSVLDESSTPASSQPISSCTTPDIHAEEAVGDDSYKEGPPIVEDEGAVMQTNVGKAEAASNRASPARHSSLLEQLVDEMEQGDDLDLKLDLSKRPKTVNDPSLRKSVRFAEEDEILSSDPSRRTKSAAPRLQDRGDSEPKISKSVSRKKPNSISCKPEEKAKPHNEDFGEGDGSGKFGANKNSSSLNGQNTSLQKSGFSHQNNGFENGSSTGQTVGQDSLKMSANSIAYAANDSTKTHSRTVGRPQSGRARWADPVISSPDHSNVSLMGRSTDGNPSQGDPRPVLRSSKRKTKPKIVPSYGTYAESVSSRLYGKKARPFSACTKSSITEDQRKHLQRKLQRPWSASHVVKVNTYDCTFLAHPVEKYQQNSTSVPKRPDFPCRPLSGKKKRPISGIKLATVPTEKSFTEDDIKYMIQSDPGFSVTGCKMTQNLKAGFCSQCKKATSKIADYSEETGYLVCEVCDRKAKAELHRQEFERASEWPQEDEGYVVEDEAEVAEDEEILDDPCVEDEVQIQSDSEEDANGKLNNCDPKQEPLPLCDHKNDTRFEEVSSQSDPQKPADEGQQTALMTNLEDIDKSLDNVQEEIRRCIEQTRQSMELNKSVQEDEENRRNDDQLDKQTCTANVQIEEKTGGTKNENHHIDDKDDCKDEGVVHDLDNKESADDVFRRVCIESGLQPGEMSQLLLEGKCAGPSTHLTYDMRVFHFEEHSNDSSEHVVKKERPWSGRKTPASDHNIQGSQAKVQGSTTEHKDQLKGEINTYTVKMVKSGAPDDIYDILEEPGKIVDINVPEQPQLDGQECGKRGSFLEDVCQMMPESRSEMSAGNKNKTTSDELAPKLEVKATATELKSRNNKPVAPPSPMVAPYPPLCFRVNARPPRGYLYYFAYGTDMNPNRLSTYVSREVEERQWGLLFGFRLVFNKKGVDAEAGGFPNLDFNPHASVEGCLYLITPQELELLDRCMGYPEHYEHVVLPVWLLNCEDPDICGVAQYCVPALMYIAQDKWIAPDDEMLNASYTVDQCKKNADLLTPAYREQLDQKTVTRPLHVKTVFKAEDIIKQSTGQDKKVEDSASAKLVHQPCYTDSKETNKQQFTGERVATSEGDPATPTVTSKEEREEILRAKQGALDGIPVLSCPPMSDMKEDKNIDCEETNKKKEENIYSVVLSQTQNEMEHLENHKPISVEGTPQDKMSVATESQQLISNSEHDEVVVKVDSVNMNTSGAGKFTMDEHADEEMIYIDPSEITADTERQFTHSSGTLKVTQGEETSLKAQLEDHKVVPDPHDLNLNGYQSPAVPDTASETSKGHLDDTSKKDVVASSGDEGAKPLGGKSELVAETVLLHGGVEADNSTDGPDSQINSCIQKAVEEAVGKVDSARSLQQLTCDSDRSVGSRDMKGTDLQ